MIKNWKSFNESKSDKPGANIPGSKKISISEEEVGLFTDETALQKLLFDYKVSILDNAIWYWEGDEETLAILDQYLEIPVNNKLKEVTESVNLDAYYETNISLMEFASYVDRLNSGSDRDCVFSYLEDFLKNEKNIDIDIESAIGEESGL